MASPHIALLRGINVGRAKRIAMADLRALMDSLGFREVRTLLNSGNIIFTVPPRVNGDIAGTIERGLIRKLGVASRVIVLTAAEVATIVRENPLGHVADNPSRLLVSVLADPAERAKLTDLAKRDWAPEAMALGRRVSYLWCPDGMIESPLAEAVGRVTGDRATTRNWATILRLHGLAGG